jgi:DegV family protein with EDD domain
MLYSSWEKSFFISLYKITHGGKMQIVTDQGMDLSPEQSAGLEIHYVPLRITLDGKTFIGAEDVDYVTFYKMLQETKSFPTTSQPSPGDFADKYREIAKNDPDILSIHLSSGLSGTVNSARLGAEMVPEANVTVIDSKTLSCPLGWQVQAAALALKAGWDFGDILKFLDQIREKTEALFTLNDLKYLIHGGRISHLKGLMGSILKIKPVIGVAKDDGKYYPLGQEFTFKKAIYKLADLASQKFPKGTALRVQLMHGDNPSGIELLKERLTSMYECVFEPVVPVAPLLGAHTGPSVVGIGVAPLHIFDHPDLYILPVVTATA